MNDMHSADVVASSPALVATLLGPFGPAQIACLRSWADAGYCTAFVHVTDRKPAPLVAGSADFYMRIAPSELKSPAGEAAVLDFLFGIKADGITCLSYHQIEWLNSLRGKMRRPTSPWIPMPDAVAVLQSKASMTELAKASGLPVLPTAFVDRTTWSDVPDEFFPVAVRPEDITTVEPAFKVRYISTRQELEAFVRSLDILKKPLLVQPYKRAKNFVVHGARGADGTHFPNAAFVADCAFNGVIAALRPAPFPGPLEEGCRRFCEKLDIHGVYHFDFLFVESEDRHYFLEMNGRLGGTTAKVFRLGYDEPGFVPGAYGTGRRPISRPVPNRQVASYQATAKFLLSSLRGQLTMFDYPNLGFWRLAIKLLPAVLSARSEVWDWRYPRTSIAYAIQQVMRL